MDRSESMWVCMRVDRKHMGAPVMVRVLSIGRNVNGSKSVYFQCFFRLKTNGLRVL